MACEVVTLCVSEAQKEEMQEAITVNKRMASLAQAREVCAVCSTAECCRLMRNKSSIMRCK